MTAAGLTRSAALRWWPAGLDRFAQASLPLFLALFAASALLNVLVGIGYEFRASPGAMDMDEQEYYSLSSQILGGNWDLGARRTDLFPAILAGLRLIDGNFRILQIAVSITAALSAPLLSLVVRRLSGSARAGLIAGILMMLWPMQFFLATSLYSETVALPCFLVFLLTLPLGSRAAYQDWQAAERPAAGRGRGAIIAGLALGVTAHIRPMYLLFLPIALAIPFLEERSLRRASRIAVQVACGFAVVVLPWSLWTSSRHGETIILSANGGETLAGGLNPTLAAMASNQAFHLPSRDGWVGPGKWLPPAQTGYLTPAETRLPYQAMSLLLTQRTEAWVAAHPGEAIRTELCKLGYMWGLYPWRGESPVKLMAGSLPILGLTGLALILLLRRPHRWLGLARLWTVPLFSTGVALISWGSWRFRQPADAALLAFCVIALGTAPWRKAAVSAPSIDDLEALGMG